MSDNVVQFAFKAPPKDKPSLASLRVVEQLMADFSKGVMDIRHDFNVGKPGAQDAVRLTDELARKYGLIFLGKDPAYAPADWTPRMRGVFRYLASQAGTIQNYRNEAGTAFFVYVANIILACCHQLETKKRPDAEINADLKTAIDSVVERLLGIKIGGSE